MKTDKFAVGETINSQGLSGAGIKIEVVELLENDGLRVKLTEVNWYWATAFTVGSEHVMVKKTVYGSTFWTFTDTSLPHFALSIAHNGFRVFIN